MSEHDRERREEGYRDLVYELTRMVHGYHEIATNFGLKMTAEQRAQRGAELRECLPEIRRMQALVVSIRETLTWKLLPRTRRAERVLDEAIADNFLETWRDPKTD